MAAAADLESPSCVNGAGETRLCHTGVLLRAQQRPAPGLVLLCARSMRACGSCTRSGMALRRGGEQGWRRATLLEKSCCLVCAMSMRSSIASSESSMNGSVKSQYSVPKFFFFFCMRDVVEAMSTQRSRRVFAPSWPSCHRLRRCPSLMLQSTQFFILLPPPSNLSTRRISRTNHTDPSERIPNSNTSIDTSQSTHTHATHHLQPSNTSDPDHVAHSYAPPFLHGTLH